MSLLRNTPPPCLFTHTHTHIHTQKELIRHQLFFYGRSLPHALCRASLCSVQVLACVEVSLSPPSRTLNESAPTLTLQHFKGRPKGGWANSEMRRCLFNREGAWEAQGNQWRLQAHGRSLPEIKLSLMNHLPLITGCFTLHPIFQMFCLAGASNVTSLEFCYLLMIEKDAVKEVLAKC